MLCCVRKTLLLSCVVLAVVSAAQATTLQPEQTGWISDLDSAWISKKFISLSSICCDPLHNFDDMICEEDHEVHNARVCFSPPYMPVSFVEIGSLGFKFAPIVFVDEPVDQVFPSQHVILHPPEMTEPTTLALFGLGLIGFALRRKKNESVKVRAKPRA